MDTSGLDSIFPTTKVSNLFKKLACHGKIVKHIFNKVVKTFKNRKNIKIQYKYFVDIKTLMTVERHKKAVFKLFEFISQILHVNAYFPSGTL